MTEVTTNTNKDISNPVSFEEGVDMLYDPSFLIYGHGTNLRDTDISSVMNFGLLVKKPEILMTAKYLIKREKPLLEQRDDVLKLISGWVHNNARYVFAIKLPISSTRNSNSEYIESFFEKVPLERRGTRKQLEYVLPARYIAGYFDNGTREFYPNPNFDPSEPVKAKERWIKKASPVVPGRETPVPELSEDSDKDMVW